MLNMLYEIFISFISFSIFIFTQFKEGGPSANTGFPRGPPFKLTIL